MDKNIMNYINILHGYTTAIKNLHWSSGNMNEHELCDDIADTICDNEDLIAEVAQGIYGQIKKNELKPVKYTIETTPKMLNDLLRETETFYGKIKENKKYIGLRSIVENFLGEINKYQYLIKLCLKEDLKRRIEGNKQVIHLTESDIHRMIKESVRIMLRKK